jgi:2'-5' RNA ligase
MNRLFLAQPVTLFDYQSIQNDFKDVVTGRWVPMQNLHLTLQFFGDKFEKQFILDKLYTLQIKTISSDLIGLSLLNDNTILYAKTQDSSIQKLHKELEKTFDLSCTQEFIPHITLMRIKKINHLELLEKRLRLYDDKVIGILQSKIQLIQSHLTPQGAKYTLLEEF